MTSILRILGAFFGVFLRGRTYLGLIFNILAFPLGLLYFVFLVTGFSVGLSTIIIWVGLLVLALMFPACWALAAFERWQVIGLLKEDIPPLTRPLPAEATTWERVKSHLKNPVTWTSIAYLLLKFPLGLLVFVVLVTLGAITAVCLAAIFLFPFLPLQVWFTNTTYWSVDTLPEALVLFVLGLFGLLVTLHASNLMAWISGKFAKLMLGQLGANPAQPEEPAARLEDTPAFVTPGLPVIEEPAGPAPQVEPEPDPVVGSLEDPSI